MYGAYKRSPFGAFGGYVRVFEHEIDAVDFCDVRNWEYLDEYGIVWKLDYQKIPTFSEA